MLKYIRGLDYYYNYDQKDNKDIAAYLKLSKAKLAHVIITYGTSGVIAILPKMVKWTMDAAKRKMIIEYFLDPKHKFQGIKDLQLMLNDRLGARQKLVGLRSIRRTLKAASFRSKKTVGKGTPVGQLETELIICQNITRIINAKFYADDFEYWGVDETQNFTSIKENCLGKNWDQH
jgi:hypothetical protein